MSTIPLTKRGAEKLKEELHRLKHVERPAVVMAIAEARAQGDLSENAEYDAAKDKQGFIEGRILEVEGKLAVAKVIDPSELDAEGRVVFGATVDLEEEASGNEVTYQITGDDEADIKLGRISISSPIARALTETQRRDVAAYYQSLPNAAWSGRPDTPVRQLQRGATLAALGDAAIAVQGCINCHGPAGAGLPPVYPWLGGQHAAYLEAQLQAWKSGARGGDAMAVMSNIAQRLSDADITAVSAYYASLRTQPSRYWKRLGESLWRRLNFTALG
mgnify:CR=1 FL=1